MSEPFWGPRAPLMAPEMARNIGRIWLAMSEQYELAEMHEESERAQRKADTWLAYAQTLAATKPEAEG